ncbi:PorP/SprF family type IX secretion system membrane protein [Crocinitomix catalasitica]|nr:PorP/SprF family type IX secretion system membrane protein [Crocinitomix catalasitica]
MKRIFGIGLLLASSVVWGQDIHFTQINENEMLLNPAMTGVFDGWERVSANHKNQWINAGTKFFTTSITADLNILKPKRGDRAHLGLGLQFYNDIGGDSKFGTKQFNLNISGIVPLAEKHRMSAGIQFGVAQRTGDLQSLLFSNQFDGSVLDPTINPQENNNLVSFVYPDLTAGVAYHFGNHSVGFDRDDKTEFRFGVAYSHLNRPQLNYRVGYSESLWAKWTIHGDFLKDFVGTKSGIEVFATQFFQGPHTETLLGAMYRLRLTDGTKTTGLKRDMYMKLGVAWRLNDAVAPIVYFHLGSFNFGISYDVTISELGNQARSGGLEFSLMYTNLDFALFKRRGRGRM